MCEPRCTAEGPVCSEELEPARENCPVKFEILAAAVTQRAKKGGGFLQGSTEMNEKLLASQKNP